LLKEVNEMLSVAEIWNMNREEVNEISNKLASLVENIRMMRIW